MDCAAVLDCLNDISPIPHKYRICKELKKKANLGPEIKTCWEKVLAYGTSEEQLDTFDFDLIPKLSGKRKRGVHHESPESVPSVALPDSPPHSPVSVSSNSSLSTSSPVSQSSPLLSEVRRPDWKRNTESLNKPIDLNPVRLPGISSFSPTINEFEFSKSYQLNSSESVPFLNTPPANSCTCIHKGEEPRLSYKKYLTISSPPACLACNNKPKTTPSYEYIKSEFEKCQQALSTLAEMGYQLTPFINGRWEKTPISEWRIVPTSQLVEDSPNNYPSKRFRNSSLSSNNSFDSLILAAGIV
ncbi:hypothetical protein HDV06_004827 [Boothiomyces sp. JEL0866]|nr:hypothetical protein HDV06_004827 [Boothiomyces sp. JEL0866]